MSGKEKNIKKQKKRKILEKAFELFRKNGYTDTKVEDITRKLGISKGSFYTYFKTKEELLCEVLESVKKSEMKKYSKVEIDENPRKTLENFIKERFKSFLELLNNVDIGIVRSFAQNTIAGKFHEEMTKFFKSFIKENILLRYESNREYDMEIISDFIILAINNYLIEKIVCKKEYTFSSKEEFDGIVEDNQKLINEIVKFIDNALKQIK
ncbi:transcriptional regulator, TetR family [Leptotrichia shahii]|jgi:transcriptional regulator, tetR family|uniref:Transcriptional regulator, TetR family n=2 Tax=Leptotrichia shahii TaxID=157691 RepID=A0A510JQS7_9FUSO|nr:TetR/AcrR family transcriptional regulator [Leptotrichia shahii]BBM41626.1 transcriptional regulator, TetR family [Leptotrichia shahii]